jgi:hypothetical protein
MVPVSVTVRMVPGCEVPVKSEIVEVFSNEPVTGKGDNTSPDWEIFSPLSLNVRAECAPKGEGRTYTIVVQTLDELGNKTMSRTQVHVQKKLEDTAKLQPKDKGKK